jgi:chromosome segregation ATPase
LENHDRLTNELDTLRATARISEQHTRELDKVNTMNRSLSVEAETLRKTIRQKDEQQNLEKEAYSREVLMLQRKLNDLHNVVDSKDNHLRSMPKAFSGVDSMKSNSSNSPGQSTFYSNLLETKDLEIKRLSQMVKNLTESLRDTQDSKFKMKRI